ncbi:MAG: hypothetical protein LUC32_03365 [Clostridiales bacterium]|nr:hypothetical protein [Clostridiales bacterium]
MISQDRVRQMSRLAMMESDIGKNAIRVYSYRRVDYVIVQVLKGIIWGTVCFAAVMVLWLGYIWDDLNLFFADAQYMPFLVNVLKGYGIFMACYLVICALVAVVRFNRCRKQRTLYLRYLKRLRKSYASAPDADDEDE